MVLDRNQGNDRNGCTEVERLTNHSTSRRTRPWKSRKFSCSSVDGVASDQQQPKVIFIGLDQAETSIVGTIAMNLKKSCNTHNDSVLFTQQPLSAIISNHLSPGSEAPRLAAFLRQPTERAKAEFFRWISIHHLEPTDKRFRSFMSDEPQLDHYFLRQLSLEPVSDNETKSFGGRTRLRADILNNYGFLGTTERMMESLVVLKMLWDLSWKDMLHISPYHAFFLNKSNQTSCVYQVPFFTNAERESLVQSARWKRRISGDVALYGAVNARLDATIDMLGYEEVQIQIQAFQKLLQEAIDKCWESTSFPCSANGDLALHNHSCIVDEFGCGHECLNDLVTTD
jgi:hypothetical protein